jgi:hypothetical protein
MFFFFFNDPFFFLWYVAHLALSNLDFWSLFIVVDYYNKIINSKLIIKILFINYAQMDNILVFAKCWVFFHVLIPMYQLDVIMILTCFISRFSKLQIFVRPLKKTFWKITNYVIFHFITIIEIYIIVVLRVSFTLMLIDISYLILEFV